MDNKTVKTWKKQFKKKKTLKNKKWSPNFNTKN